LEAEKQQKEPTPTRGSEQIPCFARWKKNVQRNCEKNDCTGRCSKERKKVGTGRDGEASMPSHALNVPGCAAWSLEICGLRRTGAEELG
jgi:hypothetical protein